MDVVVVAVYLLWLWPFFSYLPDQPKIVFHPITITFKSKPPSTPVLSRTINLIRFLLPRNIDFQDDFHGANPVTERFRSNIDIPPPSPSIANACHCVLSHCSFYSCADLDVIISNADLLYTPFNAPSASLFFF